MCGSKAEAELSQARRGAWGERPSRRGAGKVCFPLCPAGCSGHGWGWGLPSRELPETQIFYHSRLLRTHTAHRGRSG